MFVDEQELIDVFGEGYDVTVIYIYEETVLGDLSNFERIVACGGDGTLNSIINCKLSSSSQIFYLPYGTFNESQKSVEEQHPLLSELGKAGGRYFSYVCAAGIFTPLGYTVTSKNKRRWKKLAYFSKILREYKIHRISAQMDIDGEVHGGEYSLIMAIDSRQCFGFKFNKMFAPDDGIMHFLTIKAPKHGGLIGAISLFFPLFRTFFVGFKKPYRSKKIMFMPCKKVKLQLDGEVPFDMDGERVDMQGKFDIKLVHSKFKIQIVRRHDLPQLRSTIR